MHDAASQSTTLTAEEKNALWAAADKMRGHMDAAEYKHVALGLIFLKYISDAFQERYDGTRKPRKPRRRPRGPRRVHRPRTSSGCRRRPAGPTSQAQAKQPTIGKLIDDAMDAIEKENPSLKGVLPEGLRPPDARQDAAGRADRPDRHHRALGGRRDQAAPRTARPGLRILPGQFATAEGKRGGEFYTPAGRSSTLLVEMIEPYKGRVYDPCCGSGGMFVQSEKFVEAHGGAIGRPLDLRAGVEPDDLEARQDEPGDPGHRGATSGRTTPTPSTTTCTRT